VTFAQRQNSVTTRFSERIPVVKRRITVLGHHRNHPHLGRITSQLSASLSSE